jgi:GH24 family phage-related lysozyme (muramidase)
MDPQLNIDTSALDIDGMTNSSGIGGKAAMTGMMTLDQIIKKIKKGEKIPDNIDPKLYQELTQKAQGDAQLQGQIENAISSGLMMIPGVGTAAGLIAKGGAMLGNAVANEDQYGIAKSKFSAVAGDAINPFSTLGNTAAAIKEDGFQFDDLAYAIPGVGALKARKKAVEEKDKAIALTESNRNEESRRKKTSYFSDLYANKGEQLLADGGKVKGPGTSKSDSIKTKLQEGSFVVPAENAEMAMAMGKELLGWGRDDTVDKGGNANVKISDGEVVFQPDEIQTLKQFGIDVEGLAPNSNSGMGISKKGYDHFAKGGKVEESTIDAWLMQSKEHIIGSEGLETKVYTDKKGHKTIGVGLMLEKANGERNNAAIDAIKKTGLNDEQIERLLKGQIELTDKQVNSSYDNYLNDVLVTDLKREFGKDWEKIDDQGKMIMADLMYNQGSTKFRNNKHWDKVKKAVIAGDNKAVVNHLNNDPELKNWRSETGTKTDKKGIETGGRVASYQNILDDKNAYQRKAKARSSEDQESYDLSQKKIGLKQSAAFPLESEEAENSFKPSIEKGVIAPTDSKNYPEFNSFNVEDMLTENKPQLTSNTRQNATQNFANGGKVKGYFNGGSIDNDNTDPIDLPPNRTQAIRKAAEKLGISEVEMTAIVLQESRGDFNSVGTDKATGKKYRGLIQWGEEERSRELPKIAKQLGIEYDGDPTNNSFEEQMAMAADWIILRKFVPGEMNAQQAYSTILAGKPNSTASDSNGTQANNNQDISPGGKYYKAAEYWVENGVAPKGYEAINEPSVQTKTQANASLNNKVDGPQKPTVPNEEDILLRKAQSENYLKNSPEAINRWKEQLPDDELFSNNQNKNAFSESTKVKDSVPPYGYGDSDLNKVEEATPEPIDKSNWFYDNEFPDITAFEEKPDQNTTDRLWNNTPNAVDRHFDQIKVEGELQTRKGPLDFSGYNDPAKEGQPKDGSVIPDWLNAGNVLSAGQIAYGAAGLSQMGDRPEDTIGEGLGNWIEELRNEEADGFTTEEWTGYTNEIENIRRNDLSSISALVGGDAGLAMASIIESGNRANKAITDLGVADAGIRREEEARIRGQRGNAEMFYEGRRERIKNNEIQEFDQNQAAFAEILNAGIGNMVGNNDPLYQKYRQGQGQGQGLRDGGTVKREYARGTALVN